MKKTRLQNGNNNDGGTTTTTMTSSDDEEGEVMELHHHRHHGDDENPDPVTHQTTTHTRTATRSQMTFKEKWKDGEYRGKLLYSIIMTASALATGLYSGQHGPTFLDIQIITNTDLEEASAFFTGGNAGLLAGCLVTGIIGNKVSGPLLLFLASLCLGVTNMALPFCTQFGLMVLMRFVSAVFVGTIATATNTQHLSIWGPDGNGLLQLLHFGFSIGGMASPLFAEPFLLEKVVIEESNNINTTSNVESHHNNNNYTGDPSHQKRTPESRVEYVFFITGAYIIITAIPYLIVYFTYGQTSKAIITSSKHRKFSRGDVPFRLMILLLAAYCAFTFTWNSVEPTFFSFLMIFLVEECSVTKSTGAFVTALAWGTYAVTRFLLIPLTRKFTPFQLLLFLSTSVTIYYSAFSILARAGMTKAVMVLAAVASTSMAGMFPVGLSWAEAELFQVTGNVGSCILLFNFLGATVNPMLLGRLMEQYSNMWFCYLLLIQTFLAYVILMTLIVCSRCYVDRKYGSLATTNTNNKTREIVIQRQIVQNGGTDTPGVHTAFLQ